MKRKIIAVCLIIICVFFIQRPDVYAASDIVPNDETGIPDKVLYQEILRSLDKKENDTFTKQEAASLECLDPHKRIQSFQGIGILSGLRTLELDRNKIDNSQLEVIAAELPQLERLDVGHNKITSLQPLKSMKDLTYLNVRYNRLENLEGIGELASLDYLNAEGNEIKSIPQDVEWTKLTHLDLGENKLKDLKGIERMSNLDSLYLSQNLLTSIKGVRNLKKLSYLHVADNRLVNVDEIKYLKELHDLDLSSNQIKKLPNLKSFKNLFWLDLYGNFLTKKEIKKKIPNKGIWSWPGRNKWIKKTSCYQRNNFKISFVKPAKVSRITKNTKKITGKIPKEHWKEVTLHFKVPGAKYDTYAYPDKNGKFVFSKLNLKPYAGEAAELYVYYYDEVREEGWAVNRIIFKIKN